MSKNRYDNRDMHTTEVYLDSTDKALGRVDVDPGELFLNALENNLETVYEERGGYYLTEDSFEEVFKQVIGNSPDRILDHVILAMERRFATTRFNDGRHIVGWRGWGGNAWEWHHPSCIVRAFWPDRQELVEQIEANVREMVRDWLKEEDGPKDLLREGLPRIDLDKASDFEVRRYWFGLFLGHGDVLNDPATWDVDTVAEIAEHCSEGDATRLKGLVEFSHDE